ncbi:MAG TPA: outer membrane beta-barrel protein [Lacibacter sp.]|nr:outer membrane beta-barrel protein [Lacibacter sp.]HMO88421.1 outer membrane beta-barrel protein [Lacibacter sp.]HMP85893.1 outer membrane beta-barrel protein [Lacibacter sp.]
MRSVLSLLLVVLLATASRAQQVKGTLYDTTEKKALSGATVEISRVGGTPLQRSVTSNAQGRFEFSGLPADSFLLRISYINFAPAIIRFRLERGVPVDLGTINMTNAATQLGEVVIVYQPPVRQKGDTAEYSASQYKVNPDASGEDIVKKMPGITVDRQGNVTAQGETVQRVTIDGREFFGDDATAALRNLPAEVIDKIQVFDRLSDQAQVTGVDDGNTVKAINIVTKADMRNGQYGRVFAGYGTDDRYSAGGNMTFLKENRRISVVGLTNNINQQNFAAQDLLGVTSNTNNRGGGGRPGGGMWGGGNNNFTIGQQAGISRTNAFGVNYTDKWGKKITATGSYFFNNSNNVNDQFLNRQQFLSGGRTQFYDEASLIRSNNWSHRINARLEYNIDSFNSIIITPNLSLQKNNSIRDVRGDNFFSPTQPINKTTNIRDLISNGYNLNNNILYRHSFRKRGRSVSVNFNTALNNRSSDNFTDAENIFFTTGTPFTDSLRQFNDNLTSGTTLSTNVTYTEPVGKQGQLQFSYAPSFTFNKADQQTLQFESSTGKYTRFDTVLSNKFDNTYHTHRPGITYRKGDRDNQFAIGLNYQYATLGSDQVFPVNARFERSFSNLLPNLQWRKKLSAKANLRVFYRTNANAPSVNQLQNVINNSNPLFLSTGNPELNQSFSHTLVTRYIFTNTGKGRSFFVNLFATATQDFVANATYVAAADSVLAPGVTLFRGSQLSKPINLQGYRNLRSFVTYGMPLKFIKSSINFNAGFGYTRAPGLINKVENTANTYNYNGGWVVASNISEFVDFNVSYTVNYNVVRNSIQPQLNNNFFTQLANLQFNLLSKKGWFFQNDIANQSFSGLADGFNQSFWLWNMSAGKKFLKNQTGELKLSVFDLLKQNQSIARTTTETFVQDVQNVVLQQYFMLTFTYRLRNFGKPAQNRPGMNNFRRN